MSTSALEPRGRMSISHALAVGAALLGFLFILLWASEALGVSSSTRAWFEALARDAREASLQALIRGLPLALACGAIGGAMVAIFANLFRVLDRERKSAS